MKILSIIRLLMLFFKMGIHFELRDILTIYKIRKGDNYNAVINRTQKFAEQD